MRKVFTMLATCVVLALAGCGGSSGNGGEPDGGGGGGDMSSFAAGSRKFGDTCNGQADCASGLLCESFAMHTIQRCTKSCTAATQATDCPAPSAGTCTPNLYCRFAM
jgi:hypothetical protein